MKETICDSCTRKLYCHVADRSRGMACVDYKKKGKANERKIQTVGKG